MPAAFTSKSARGSVIEPVTETLHGVTVTDLYRWLEDQDSLATRAWIEVQNNYTRGYLDAIPGREQIRAGLAALIKIDNVEDLPHFDFLAAAKAPPAKIGDWVLAFSNQFEIATRDEPMTVQHGIISAYSKLHGKRGIFEAPYSGDVYLLAPHRHALASRPLYVSFDKDVLQADEAIVNWDSGHLVTEEARRVVEAFVSASAGLAGMDVVGDWSPVRVQGLLRRFLHWTEHPSMSVHPEEAQARNEQLNLTLVELLAELAVPRKLVPVT